MVSEKFVYISDLDLQKFHKRVVQIMETANMGKKYDLTLTMTIFIYLP
jgi:hypothetical protein